MSEDKDIVEGYRQQSGKLPFSRPGSGGSRKMSKPRDGDTMASIRGSGGHKHDDVVTGSAVGRPTALIDGRWKVTGQAQYGDDVRLPGELIGRIVRSKHHYARVLSIDVSAAIELPGVVAVATGQDASGRFGVLPVTKDEHAMAQEKVRHVGDLIACVAATDEATAREAVRLVEVEYEELEAVHDMRQGLEDSDEPIHDRGKYHIGASNVQEGVPGVR